ncbi:MAG: ABC transporter ATP-binding protein [Gemmatimonadetes bacterium]|nr:ABC transporter ATP-binding protein [Gemmatimonadota bacterium]
MSDRAIQAIELRRVFRSGPQTLEVLGGVSMEVRPGEMVAIVGPSGSGKSTLLHCLGGLDRPDAGEVRIGNDDLATLSDRELARVRNRRVGFVFQFHHLLPDFSALENVMLPSLVGGAPRAEAEARAKRLLEDVGLGARLAHAPGELSGGEQQRVAVARALVNEPDVVLADEPSGNLDPRSSASLHELLEQLRRARGVALVVATHDPSLASSADRALGLRDGRLTAIDASDPVAYAAR